MIVLALMNLSESETTSVRSTRQRKAWGGAKRNPRLRAYAPGFMLAPAPQAGTVRTIKSDELDTGTRLGLNL